MKVYLNDVPFEKYNVDNGKLQVYERTEGTLRVEYTREIKPNREQRRKLSRAK